MARSRNIKPGFFKNEELGELSYETRLLFIGLWTLADREGRLEDRPRRIRAEIFPFDSIEVDPLLNELQKKKFILRYSVDKKNYIFITNFVKHQNPHYREVASIIPPPPGEDDKIVAKNVTRTQRLRILERDGYACQECGSTEQLCIDHILPVSRGGTSDDENLQVLCLSCNTKKGNSLSINYESNVIEYRPDVEPKHEHHVPLVTDSPILIPDSLNLIPLTPVPEKKEPDKSIFEAYTDNPELLQTLHDFLKMRKVIKKEMTERAIKSLLNRLDKLAGTDQGKIAILEQSIISNWANIYELKDNKSTKSSGLFPHEKDLSGGR